MGCLALTKWRAILARTQRLLAHRGQMPIPFRGCGAMESWWTQMAIAIIDSKGCVEVLYMASWPEIAWRRGCLWVACWLFPR